MNSLNFGLGRRNINPQIPITLAGYFNIRMWEKVLDDLEVRAVAFEQNGRKAFLIQFDLVTVSYDLYTAIVKAFADAGLTDIKSDNMIMTATHTHTGPEVRPSRDGSDPAYIGFVAAKTVEAVKEAMANLAPGTLECTTTKDARFLFNRRYWMKDGSVVTNPGKLNPNIRTSEGDIDPEIPMMAIRQNGKIKFLCANIVNHTDTIGGNDVSGDWAGFTTRLVQQELGEGSMVMPLIGAAGNINHFDVSTDMPQTQYSEAERIGKGYTETIIKALPDLKPFDANLLTVGKTFQVKPRELTKDEVDAAQAIMDKYPEIKVKDVSGCDLTSEDLARQTPFALKYFASKLLDMRNQTELLTCNLTGIIFGEVAMASLPSEPFVEIGMTLRKEILRDYSAAMVITHSNGTGNLKCGGGYIPNVWNYGRGGYETTPRSNPMEKQGSAKLLGTWRELIASIKK